MSAKPRSRTEEVPPHDRALVVPDARRRGDPGGVRGVPARPRRGSRAHPSRVRARRGLPAGPAAGRPEGPGPLLPDPGRRPDGARRPAHGDAGRPAAGRDHARTTSRSGSTRSPTSAWSTRARPSSRSRTTCSARSQIAQTTLRSVLGQHTLDELLAERDKINQILQEIIDQQTAPWGVKVTVVEVKDVELPTSMQRAMARQAEAERERRAKIISRRGRVPGVREAGRRRRGHRAAPDRAAAALPADAARDLVDQQLHHHPARADRPAAGARRKGRRRIALRSNPLTGVPVR